VTDRELDWPGVHNVRDLGGLPTPDGPTPARAVLRSARLDGLDGDGWAAVAASGVRTIVDLRNDDEVREQPHRPAGLTVVRAPVEDPSDAAFLARWGAVLNTPDYYPAACAAWPHLLEAAFAAIAAADGTVLFHCSAGRDRTGMIGALLLDAAGVDRAAVHADYADAVTTMNMLARAGELPPHETAQDDESLHSRLAHARSSLDAFLDAFDDEAVHGARLRAAERLRPTSSR
jgi:protein-tyrosine phosphatase